MTDDPTGIDRFLADLLATETTRAALDAAHPRTTPGPPTPRTLARDATRLAMGFLQLGCTDPVNLDKAITWLATAHHYGAPGADTVRHHCLRVREAAVDDAAHRLLAADLDGLPDPNLTRALYELAGSIVDAAEATLAALADGRPDGPLP